MQAIAFRAILTSGEYPNNMREWQNITPTDQTWDKWKINFLLAYTSNELRNKARDSVGQPFGGQAIAQSLTQQVQPKVTNQMVYTLAGYLNNIVATATTTGRGTKLADLSASMYTLVDTNADQDKELKQMREQINALCNSNNNPEPTQAAQQGKCALTAHQWDEACRMPKMHATSTPRSSKTDPRGPRRL